MSCVLLGKGLTLRLPPVGNEATTEQPDCIILYDGNIKARLYILKRRAISTEKTWLLFHVGYRKQLSHLALSRQNLAICDP